MIRRPLLAVVSALAVFLALPVLAGPAQACACGGPSFEERFAAGGVLAVVTRIDDATTEQAIFDVEEPRPAELPTRLTGTIDWCRLPVRPGQVTTVIAERKKGWVVPPCSEMPWHMAWPLLDKPGPTSSAGPAVLLLAGEYGDSGLATLDRFGKVVAWNRRGAKPDMVALCPGGRRAVAFSPGELAVYDLPDLALQRSIRIRSTREYEPARLRCNDPDGIGISMKLGEDGDDRWSQFTVKGATVTKKPLTRDKVYRRAPSFLDEGDRVIEVGAGDRRLLDGLDVAPNKVTTVVEAPDGRWAAAIRYGTSETEPPFLDQQILIFNQKTGAVRGRWSPGTFVNQIKWTAKGDLLAVVGHHGSYDEFHRGEFLRFDSALRVLTREPAPGGYLTVTGESAVFWSGQRVSVATEPGKRLIVDEIRLAATEVVVPLSEAGFVAGEEGPVELVSSLGAPSSTDGGARGVLAILALTAVGAAVLRVRWAGSER